eukprot:TRINITY_DN33779_c0_g1_i1.p1 TRINITY_DN33779_c0_g1~~TRINITY_DN33779_c0_g1_i1.p1  ORF type:complete len:223 (-),score=39.13 TRINITY_DN33779_c0_g1_i1:134-802(-)
MTSILDVEPIYSAEQIVVPTEFPDIIKAFTKEVIRNQPENIAEFSANYFANLAHLASEYGGGESALHVNLLIELRKALDTADKNRTGRLSQKQIEDTCHHLGLAPHMMNAVFKLGDFTTADCDWREFIVLGSALLAQDLMSAIKMIFEVFSTQDDLSLPRPYFLELFNLLTQRDRLIDDEFRATLGASIDTSSSAPLTWDDFQASGPAATLRKLNEVPEAGQ